MPAGHCAFALTGLDGTYSMWDGRMVDEGKNSAALYEQQGMGRRIGFGQRPAVLVIDMQHDFCDPDAPTTLWPSIGATFEPIRRLCADARARRLPVFYTQGLVAADGSSAGLWRYKQRYHAEGRIQIDGSRGAAIIDELAAHPGDHVIRKWRPSAFFRTDFEVFLNVMAIDTLLVCGTSVSGCVRATVTDAFMRDIRCMVVRECVADRTPAVLEGSLFDMDQKYADVVTVQAALDYLNSFPLKN
jgi:maleamate amidohydrolase